jgi:hypothetical protein
LTERVGQSVSVALLAVALAGLAGFLWSWPPTGEASEVALKGFLAILVLAALAGTRLAPLRSRTRASLAIHALCALAAVFAYYNFGRFHFPQFAHYWEQFHYQLGARYFPELGYDGLYMASITAQRELDPARAPQRKVRDLRTNRVRLYEKIENHASEVRERFGDERWKGFVDDSRHFVRAIQPADLEAMRRDHGYNPTPAWTFVAQLFQGDGRIMAKQLRRLGGLDSLLLAIAFAVLFRTYGLRVGCLCLVIFGLGYAGRFKWIGGAFLRFDWLAAIMLGVCALQRGRAASAGALFGYATAVRLFPAAFLFGPLIAAVAALRRGERPSWALRFAAGFSAAILLALALGGMAGRGAGAWGEFADRMQMYQRTMARNAVGLEWLVLYGGETLDRAAANLRDDSFWPIQREEVVKRKRERRVPLRVVQALWMLLLGAAAWRAPPAQAAVLSMVALFGLTTSATYYWSMLLLAPLALRWPAVAGLLALNAAMYLVHVLQADKLVRYGLLSWGLAALFLAWILPEAIRTLRGLPSRLLPADR